MRIKITLESLNNNNIVLPKHYNYLLQGVIYRNLTKCIARRVHDIGYKYKNRDFRLFTFSRFFGQFEARNGNLIYIGKYTLWIASPMVEILESFASTLARKGKIKLGNNFCRIIAIEVPFSEEYKSAIFVRTLSPITIYSTLLTQDKRKKTYYYTPFENEFSKLLKENLLKKYALVYGKENNYLDFSIKPEKVSNRNEHVIFYKDTVVKAWSGIYKISGAKELIKLAFDCGLGAKNSQGFGMIEKYEPEFRLINSLAPCGRGKGCDVSFRA